LLSITIRHAAQRARLFRPRLLAGRATVLSCTSSDPHTVRAFESELQDIARKIAAMGGVAEKQITDAVRALVDHDTELAEYVIAADPTLDAMQGEIEQMAVQTLARRQPMAVDLREIVAAMLLCSDIERIGDHAKHIGKRVVAL